MWQHAIRSSLWCTGIRHCPFACGVVVLCMCCAISSYLCVCQCDEIVVGGSGRENQYQTLKINVFSSFCRCQCSYKRHTEVVDLGNIVNKSPHRLPINWISYFIVNNLYQVHFNLYSVDFDINFCFLSYTLDSQLHVNFMRESDPMVSHHKLGLLKINWSGV